MDQRVKKLWIDALTSREYKQGIGRLQSDSRFCCLGVLCELAVKEGVCSVQDDWGNVFYDGAEKCLPQSVKEWARLDDPYGKYNSGSNGVFESSLVDDNDSGETFKTIANIIERNF